MRELVKQRERVQRGEVVANPSEEAAKAPISSVARGKSDSKKLRPSTFPGATEFGIKKEGHERSQIRNPKTEIRNPKTIAITSGKGGVGKTSVVANLGILCAQWGYRVAILDADLSLANIDVILGLRPKFNLSHVIFGEKQLSEILLKGPCGITIIPASCGIEPLAGLTEVQIKKLLNDLDQLTHTFDLLFIDTGAGVSKDVLSFVLSADEAFIITTPEPTAMTDAYAMIKIITQQRKLMNSKTQTIKLLINMVDNSNEALDVVERIRLVTEKFLNTQIEYVGHILRDKKVNEAIMAQNPLILSYPTSKASKCISFIAKQIVGGAMEGGRQKEDLLPTSDETQNRKTKSSVTEGSSSVSPAKRQASVTEGNIVRDFFSKVIQWGQREEL